MNNDIENASSYLTKFSRLMRLILDNSREDWVPLEQELRALELYIGMESLRFDHSFDWKIHNGDDIDIYMTIVPPMVIQPYVENAIWHGLLHKKNGKGKLIVSIEKDGDILVIMIEDNGVGRSASKLLKGQMGAHKKSHGMNITSERMDTINKVYHADLKLDVMDKYSANGVAEGTQVNIRMKYMERKNTSSL